MVHYKIERHKKILVVAIVSWKSILCMSSECTRIWWYLAQKSNLLKNLAPYNSSSITSIVGIEKRSIMLASLRLR